MDVIYRPVSKKLKALRKSRGLSQVEIAEHLGIAQSTYAGYETASRKITLNMLVRLSDYFGVSIDSLLKGANVKMRENRTSNLYASIQQLCKKHNITIAFLERACGLGNGTIKKWGTAASSVDRLKKVADYFGVSIDSLLKDDFGKNDGGTTMKQGFRIISHGVEHTFLNGFFVGLSKTNFTAKPMLCIHTDCDLPFMLISMQNMIYSDNPLTRKIEPFQAIYPDGKVFDFSKGFYFGVRAASEDSGVQNTGMLSCCDAVLAYGVAMLQKQLA